MSHAILVTILVIILICVAVDTFAAATNGDRRLWEVVKGALVLIAVICIINRVGFLT